MGLLKTLIVGRENGIRARVRKMLFGGPVDTSPGSAYSAPRDEPPPPAEAALGLHPEAPKDVTPPDGYEVVLHKDALVAGRVTEIIIAGTAIAVSNVDGTFYASTNTCPHAGGPMGEGELEGSVLTCPYHGWAFDLADGTCETNPDVKLQLYDVQVVGDAVCVRI
jgi:nitrite reductase (NADH) small subunit